MAKQFPIFISIDNGTTVAKIISEKSEIVVCTVDAYQSISTSRAVVTTCISYDKYREKDCRVITRKEYELEFNKAHAEIKIKNDDNT